MINITRKRNRVGRGEVGKKQGVIWGRSRGGIGKEREKQGKRVVNWELVGELSGRRRRRLRREGNWGCWEGSTTSVDSGRERGIGRREREKAIGIWGGC